MRVFEITAPDGRRIRHEAADDEVAAARLQPGYRVSGEVIGADAALGGGHVIPLCAGLSPLSALLTLYGDELLAWLQARGFKAAE